MKVLIIGSGGREHALAWKVAQAARVEKVFVAPGNAGTAHEAKVRERRASTRSISSSWSTSPTATTSQLTIVGPEAPLVAGVVDAFRAARPAHASARRQAAAQLEGSKAFTKDFLARHKIPTAAYQNFTEVEPALAYLRETGRADRGQGRRPGRRQGRDRRR